MHAIDEIIEHAYKTTDFPALNFQTETWAKNRPLDGLRIIDASPIFRNTLTKYRALIAAGAQLSVGLTELFPHDPKIKKMLEEAGVPVVRNDEQTFDVDLILDNAGSFSAWSPRLGYVELTRSGAEKYAVAEKPVFFADGGRIKRIETCLGTGEGFYRAMEQLGYADWNGKKLLVFGSGKVGSGLVFYAKRKGAHVTVVSDPASATPLVRSRADAIIDFRDEPAVIAAVSDAFAVVSATGVCGAHDRGSLPEALAASSALLANMGVEDEFGPRVPATRVLGEKKSLNFFLEEPTHLRYIDATLALHNAGAVFLAKHAGTLASGLLTPPESVEEEILRITRERGIIAEEMKILGELEDGKKA